MVKLPQRDDLIYKEIEEFQDYELTNCIAYEMLIKNKQYEQNRKELLETWKEFRNTDLYDDSSNFFIKNEKLQIKIEELEKKLLEQGSDALVLNFSETQKLNKKINPLYRFIPYLNVEYKKGYLQRGNNIYNDKNATLNIKISRPILKFENIKTVDVSINLNLPKEELIAYISKIKDDFDKNNLIIKTPLELLGETLEKSDNKKIPKKPKASVYADWFYIYDYWKYEKALGKTDKDIFVALEVENDVPYKEDMLRKIRDKIKYFIDDLGYKELITGVKNS